MSVAAFASQLESKLGPGVLARLAEEIAFVEAELERRVDSPVELVREASLHTLRAGGKRLRPALVTLCAEATGRPYDPDRTRRLGACMEMIHMATLMHDDVIDHASTRRGLPTAASEFGNTASILTGDVLLSRAMAILAEDGDLAIIRNVSRSVVDLAEGEVHELSVRGRLDLSAEEHFQILHRKTATFIASCCEVGGMAAAATPAVVESLGVYGAEMGLAFQIADDLLDFRSDPELTGKPRCTDFKEGCATLPIILLWPRLSELERAEIEVLFGGEPSDADLVKLSESMEAKGVLQDAEAVAQRHIENARRALESLPPTHSRDLLASVAEFVVWRKA